MVLGFTMAEIMVLILFMLLLILAATLEMFEKEIKHIGDLLINNKGGITVENIIQRITILQREVERLKPYEEHGQVLESIIKEIRRSGEERPTPQQIIDKLNEASQLIKDNANLKGQNLQLSAQIKKSGRGNEFPSCWVTSDGKPESIFELLITESGIQIKDRLLPHRVDDKTKLPLSAVRYNMELPLADFEAELRPLYQWSVEHDCRFYAIIASAETSAAIRLVNAVNRYFYPDGKIQYRPNGL